MAQIFFFGGSNVYGIGDPKCGWADRFKRLMHETNFIPDKDEDAKYHTVFNLGVPGHTTALTLERMQWEIQARLTPENQFMVVVSVGTNDSRAAGNPLNYISNIEEYQLNLLNMLEFLSGYTKHILMVGLTPVDDARTHPAPDMSYFSRARIFEFDEAMAKICEDHHVPRVDLFEPMMKLPDWLTMLHEDGQHLNEKGHEWVYSQVYPEVAKMVERLG